MAEVQAPPPPLAAVSTAVLAEEARGRGRAGEGARRCDLTKEARCGRAVRGARWDGVLDGGGARNGGDGRA